jgi:hypothetical protein
MKTSITILVFLLQAFFISASAMNEAPIPADSVSEEKSLIILDDGTEYVGRILSHSGDSIIFFTNYNKNVSIKNNKISIIVNLLDLIPSSNYNYQSYKISFLDSSCKNTSKFSKVYLKDKEILNGFLISKSKNSTQIISSSNNLLIIPNDFIDTDKSEFSNTTSKLIDSSSNDFYKIILKDGNELTGHIISFTNNIYKFKTTSDIIIEIPAEKVSEIKKMAGQVVGGEFRRFDPNRTRLFFAPTGRPLDAGEGYFSDSELFFPMVAVGVTDFMSLAGGFSLFPGSTQIYYGNLKVTPYSSDKFSLSLGGLIMGVLDFSGGILYSSGTYGDNNNALTIGLGLPYNSNDFGGSFIILIGGELRASNSIKFITENWIFSDVALISFGIRFFGDNLSADFGLITSTKADFSGFPFVPWLGFSYNFGR